MNHISQLEQISFYLTQLKNWVENNGWAGWDPYDLWDNHFGMWMMKRENIMQRISRSLLSSVNEFYPIQLRKILRVKPNINPKAIGLFAASFLKLELFENVPIEIKGEPGYEPCFRWLDSHKVEQFGGNGWGYPFNWKSRVLIPKNTPTVVNSAIIGDAYWLKYKFHSDMAALSICENICDFIVSGLNRSGYKADGSFCFSYTPVDSFQVHNANLFGAEFLIRIGTEIGHDEWIRIGLAAAKFSLSEILVDGTLNYWSNDQAHGLQQDTYHSGFEIRSLNSIALLTGEKKYKKAADKYFNTWLKDFFSKEYVPCFKRGQTNSLEIHSCTEALLCVTRMFESGNCSKEFFLKYVNGILYAVQKLWVQETKDKGYFAAKAFKRFGFNIKVNIPYIRWGESWMFNALSNLIGSLNSENGVK